eukprot:COSAG01_NODE_1460_length_10242_cov_285.193631_4_plen_76_part_00
MERLIVTMSWEMPSVLSGGAGGVMLLYLSRGGARPRADPEPRQAWLAARGADGGIDGLPGEGGGSRSTDTSAPLS